MPVTRPKIPRVGARGPNISRSKSTKGISNRRPEPSLDNIKPSDKPKMQGVGFATIVFIGIIDDILDIVLDLTGVGSIVASFIQIIPTVIIFLYLLANKIKVFGRVRKIFLGTLVVEFIPFVQFLPATTISLFMIKKKVNSKPEGEGQE